MKSEIVNQKDIQELGKTDVVFLWIGEKYGDPPNWSRPQGFQTLCQIILEQQVSLESAKVHFNKLKSIVDNFSPESIIALSNEKMRGAQISRQKSSYLKNLSEAILNGELMLENFPDMTESEIREELTSIKGIGKWTSDVYLMFCLQAKDIMPLGDIAIVNTIKELKKVETDEEIINITKKWQPLRSLGSFFLWHYYLTKRGRKVDG